MKLLFALLLIITLGALVQAQAPRAVQISASKILSEVAERKKKQPGITSKELAAYANELLETRGFDYDFDVCDILSARDKKSTASFLSKPYRAKRKRSAPEMVATISFADAAIDVNTREATGSLLDRINRTLKIDR